MLKSDNARMKGLEEEKKGWEAKTTGLKETRNKAEDERACLDLQTTTLTTANKNLQSDKKQEEVGGQAFGARESTEGLGDEED